MSSKPLLWEDLAWPDVPASLRRNAGTVLWPFGATEQHGPHLGLGTDTWIAWRVCEAVSAETGVPVLPAMPVGCSLGHSRLWPGTLSLSPGTLARVVVEAGGWLHAAGVRRLIIVNGHMTNFAPLRCALEELRAAFADLAVALIGTGTITPQIAREFCADAEDWHANDAETSLVMHLHPDGVVPGRVAGADDPDRTRGLVFAHPVDRSSENGVTGKPSLASAEKGRALFEKMIAELSAIVRRAREEEPPLARRENI